MNIINIAESGADAAKAWLDITSQNISNEPNENYFREGVSVSSVGVDSGGGVKVNGFVRYSDSWANQQVRSQTGELAGYNTQYTCLSNIDTYLGSNGTSINTGIQSFFSSLTKAQADPSSSSYRQSVLSQATQLANLFNTASSQINKWTDNVKQQLQSTIPQTNQLLTQIAKLNKQIVAGKATGQNVNSLIDQREGDLKTLSKSLSVKTLQQPNGSVNVMLSNGNALITGSMASQLKLTTGASGIPGVDLVSGGHESSLNLTKDSTLGALFNVNLKTLQNLKGKINSLAKQFADSFNKLQSQGSDKNGNPGTALFSYNANDPAGSLKVAITDPAILAFAASGSGPGDGSNLNKMIALNSQSFSALSGSSFSGFYSSVVNQNANATATVKSQVSTATSLLASANAHQQSVSGVNMGTQSANLLRYTQAYQANAKVLSTASTIFSALLNMTS